MGKPDCRIGRVYRLASRTGRAKGIFPNLSRVDFHIKFLCFRQYSYSGGRGMNPSLCLCLWHTLHPVNAGLILHNAVNSFAGHIHDDLLVSTYGSFCKTCSRGFPSFVFKEFHVHPVEIPCKNTGLIAPGTCTDLHDCGFIIYGIRG